MKKAFSLIELLISLITISVIIASFAPVITQKLKYGKVAVTKGETITNKCDKFSPDCKLCTKKQCLICTKTCLSNQYLDRDNCNCVSCPNNCESCNELGCTRCKTGYQKKDGACEACQSGYYSLEGGTCQKCPKGSMANSAISATGCIQCPLGTYQDETGKTSCKSCSGSNQYQDGIGQSICKTCGVNSIPNSNHTGCNSTCVDKSTCGSNQYHDNCHCQNCSTGQIPNSDKTGCYTPAADCSADGKYYIASSNSCGDCAAGCKKCTSSTACTECTNSEDYKLVNGVCKEYKYPASQADCDRLSNNKSIYIPLDVDKYDKATLSSTGGTHGFCMTKRNAGDLNGPSIPTVVTEIDTVGRDRKTYCKNEGKCCWIGHSGKIDENVTAKIFVMDGVIHNWGYCTEAGINNDTIKNIPVLSKQEDNKYVSLVSPYDYESCNRTVCNWWAANYICSNYIPEGGSSKIGDWIIPTDHLLFKLKDAINAGPNAKFDKSTKINIQNWSGSNGLQLCQSGRDPDEIGSPRCDYLGSWCAGASNGGACNPNYIWGNRYNLDGTFYGSFAAYFDGRTMSWHTGNMYKEFAGSTRCVLEKYTD